MKKYTVHIVWLVVALAALGGGYAWGHASAGRSGGGYAGAGAFASSTRRSFAGGGASGGGIATGQISAMDSSSITLQLANGNSEVVFYSSSTQISEPKTVPVSDLAVGTNVMVAGTSNSDGSLTAESIQVRPSGSAGGAGSAPGGGSTSGQ